VKYPLLLILFIAFQLSAFAQRGIELVDAAKFKIKKLTIRHYDGKTQWVHFYNEKGQIVKVESQLGQVLSEYSYNANSLLAEVKRYTWQDARQTLVAVETNSYDAKNRLLKLQVTDGNKNIATWTYEYDDKGNKVKATKRSGTVLESINSFDYANGKLIEERLSSPKGVLEKTTYKYDSNGFLIEKKWTDTNRPPKMESWKYAYDASGRLAEEQYFYGRVDAGVHKYHYTSNGLLESWTTDGYGGEAKTVFIAEFY
jgi:hypothetical protein